MKLSIIVPVYNAAPWLERCLDSLLDQGLDDSEYEIILVDDGSTDASPGILARYAAAHPRIRVLTQANGGQWAARNKGLETARGEWIGFVDADDYLIRKGFSHLLPFCDASTEGVRFYSQLLTPGLASKEESFLHPEVSFRGNGQEFITRFGLEFFCWGWLYSKRFLDKHGIRFPEGQGEDLSFLYYFLSASPAVISLPLNIYRYEVHENSVTTRNEKDYCRKWAGDMISVFSDIKKHSASFRDSDPPLYYRVRDSLSLRMPMLFSRIFKANLTVREFKQIRSRLQEGGLIPARSRSARLPLKLSLSGINIISACPILYIPAKWLYKVFFLPVVWKRLNRNRDSEDSR